MLHNHNNINIISTIYINIIILSTICLCLFSTTTSASIISYGNESYPFYWLWKPETKKFGKEKHQLLDSVPSVQSDFQTKKPEAAFRSFSQRKQDWLLVELVKDKSDGYFVDLAANDWIKFSNTFLVEYFNNWKGLCIEPNPKYLENLLSYRKCQIFTNPVTDKRGDKVTFSFGNNEFGGIVGKDYDNKEVNGAGADLSTVTLTDMLDQAKAPSVIDYMSLDVEGAEYQAMLGLNFTKYAIQIIMIERPVKALHHLLIRNGYVFVYVMNMYGDALYFHNTYPNLVEEVTRRYQYPPGCWGAYDCSYLKHPKWHGNYNGYSKEEPGTQGDPLPNTRMMRTL